MKCYAYPYEVTKYIGNKEPLGTASITSFLFKLYDVSIWTKGKRFSWNQPFVLYLKYARSFSRQELVDATIDEMKRIDGVRGAAEQSDKEIFNSMFPSVNAGDSISAVYLPNKAIIFYYNSREIGTITNMVLARQFLNIWLSDRARDPDARRRILNE